MEPVIVIGAGLAGSEAAWQLAQRGIPVRLHEMKPEKMTPAHHSADFAELVCSNSLRSNELSNASGLLKEELRRLGGLVVSVADETQVEAGGALAVDREVFASRITEKIRNHPHITVVPGEVTALPETGEVIVATGPLTSDALFDAIHAKVGGDFLHFFDAAAPIVTFESVDMDNAYFASRYDKGTPDYINCPFTREEFDARLSEELEKPQWIIDGNYNRTMPQRLEKCDTVIYLDFNRFVCLWGAVKRVIRGYGKTRPDMGGNCPERFDWEFIC